MGLNTQQQCHLPLIKLYKPIQLYQPHLCRCCLNVVSVRLYKYFLSVFSAPDTETDASTHLSPSLPLSDRRSIGFQSLELS